MACLYVMLLGGKVITLFGRPGKTHGVYLNLSHENLAKRGAIAAFRARHGARLVFFVHDLIPIAFPEYARPGLAKMHRQRVETVAALADAVLVNSAATGQAFLAHLTGRPAVPAVHVVHLGVTTGPQDAPGAVAEAPYFLCVATIEPRKNHLLLLTVWRSLAQQQGKVPRLVIVGRRGWENEMVLDVLERCEALSSLVEERRDVSDAELFGLVRGARAVLLPSFAEGYGLPAPEALHAGTPVICSDLPAIREVCGDVPDYLDPLDGLGWRQAIIDYTAEESPRRAAQMTRLRGWSAPSWGAHFAAVRGVIKQLFAEAAAE